MFEVKWMCASCLAFNFAQKQPLRHGQAFVETSLRYLEIRFFFVENLMHFQNWLVFKGLTRFTEKNFFSPKALNDQQNLSNGDLGPNIGSTSFQNFLFNPLSTMDVYIRPEHRILSIVKIIKIEAFPLCLRSNGCVHRVQRLILHKNSL